MENIDIKKLAEVAQRFIDAQDALDDFLDDLPCPDAYDEEQELEYRELKEEKWNAHSELNDILWHIKNDK